METKEILLKINSVQLISVSVSSECYLKNLLTNCEHGKEKFLSLTFGKESP